MLRTEGLKKRNKTKKGNVIQANNIFTHPDLLFADLIIKTAPVMATTNTFRKELVNLQSNLLSFAYQLTSDRDAAADLLQETTLKALDNEEKFTSDANFKGWVFTIMRNIFINNYRRAVRQATIVDTSEDLYQLNSCQESALESPEDTIAVKDINDILKTFDADFRIPFNMHVAGYKYSEIAEHLNLPVGTVKSRIFFTRKRLRAALS